MVQRVTPFGDGGGEVDTLKGESQRFCLPHFIFPTSEILLLFGENRSHTLVY